MYEILKLLLEICLFKKGPQDVPYSIWLLRLFVLVYAGIRYLMLVMHTDHLHTFLQILVEIVLILAFSWLMLYINRKLDRFYQVSCAFIGTDTMLNFFVLPGVLSLEIGQGGWPVFIVMLVLLAWQCAVIAHIIHQSLDQNLFFSFGLSVFYLLASYQVIAVLFPEVASTH
ncbi:MAG: hypothetical protein HOP23_05495 [Methylococcaceae bacterium]|nr:hypothetical protein [Methylococcaceae bacterium]